MHSWPGVGRWLPLSRQWPHEHTKRTALSQCAADVGTVADDTPDDTARGRAASCRTGARSMITILAAVHGRKRTTRCAAYLQRRIVVKQTSRSAARARPCMGTNRLAHREHRLVRSAASSWLGGIQCRLGAHTGDAADGCTSHGRLPSSLRIAIGQAHSGRHDLCACQVSAHCSDGCVRERYTGAPRHPNRPTRLSRCKEQ